MQFKRWINIRDFRNISGSSGQFQKDFKVYQREGLSCKRSNCKGIIKKIFQKIRSFVFLSKIINYLIDRFKFAVIPCVN